MGGRGPRHLSRLLGGQGIEPWTSPVKWERRSRETSAIPINDDRPVMITKMSHDAFGAHAPNGLVIAIPEPDRPPPVSGPSFSNFSGNMNSPGPSPAGWCSRQRRNPARPRDRHSASERPPPAQRRLGPPKAPD